MFGIASFVGRALTAFLMVSIASVGHAEAVTLEQMKKRGLMTVCANPDSMPFADGLGSKPAGLQVDLARALGRELAVDVEFSWIEMRYQAAYVECDAFMGVGILPNDDSPLKKTEPILWIEWLAVTKPGRSISKIEDMDHLRVAVQSGSMPHAALLKRPVDISVARTRDGEVLDAVASGEVDVGFVTNIGLGWYLKRHPNAAFTQTHGSIVNNGDGYFMGIGFRRSDSAMAEEANRILDKLRKSGELATMFANYGLSPAKMHP